MQSNFTKLQKVGTGLDIVAGGAMTLFPEYKWIAVLAIAIGTAMVIWPFIKPYLIPEKKLSKLSIEWSQESIDRMPDNEIASLWHIHCFLQKDGEYQCSHGSSGFNKKAMKGPLAQKIILTNYGNNPIFKLEIPVHAHIGIRHKKNEHYKVHNENICIFSGPNKETIEPGESMVIYLANSSDEKYIAVLKMLDYVEANLFGSDDRVKIAYTWKGFHPLQLELIGGTSI